MFAKRALLEFLSFDEFHELLIIFIHGMTYLILLARLAFMELHSTVKTVVLFAFWAFELYFIFPYKSILTVYSGTP